jgi:single-strand DNA-binding protein
MEQQMTLVGNIGKRINVSLLNNGSKVAHFDLVTTSQEKGKVNFQWHRLFCFGNLAQFIADYAENGKRIAITGKPVSRSYIAKSGEKKNTSEIEVRQIIGL